MRKGIVKVLIFDDMPKIFEIVPIVPTEISCVLLFHLVKPDY